MRMPPVQLDYFEFRGGLDLVTPPLSIKAGMCREAQNYEIGVNGGYRRLDGYERYDGRAAPSEASYTMLPCTITGTIVAGNTVTGLASSATGVVIAVEAAAVVVTKMTGTFTSSEALRVSGVTQATMTSTPVDEGSSSVDLHWQYLKLAGDSYRTNITVVPGSGDVLGVVYFNGYVYAFRNNAGGTAAVMHKSSAAGWTTVTTPALAPDGRYEFDIYNFGDGDTLFGCDGANKAFKFDGTTFTQLTTGMSPDTPKHITGHRNHLFLAFGNSLQHSAISDPTNWTPVLGAGELNIGQEVTNLLPQQGDAQGAAMAIYGRNSTFMLYGNSSADWNLVTVQADAGAFAGTVQYLGQTFAMDDRGVTTLQTSQNYGNFSSSSVSELIRPMIIENKSSVSCSGVNRDKNQYRLFFNSGLAIYMTLNGGFMPMTLRHTATCYWSSEDSQGNEVSFFGTTDGYVMQMDRGNNFDGEIIEAYISLVFNHSKSPRMRKRYRKAVVEVSGTGYAQFYTSADLSYANSDVDPIPLALSVAQLSAGRWDAGVWDVGAWDGRILAPSEFELAGTAENIALRFIQSSNYQAPLTFFGCLLHYTPRRQLR
jgi:hypothetical protein